MNPPAFPNVPPLPTSLPAARAVGDDPSLRTSLTEVFGDGELLFLPGFDDCILGVVDAGTPRVAYGVERIVKALVEREGIDPDAAADEYSRRFGELALGPRTPIFVLEMSVTPTAP